MRKQLSNSTLSEDRPNMFKSYVKLIIMLTYNQGQLQRYITITRGMTTLFATLIISVNWTEYQCNFDIGSSNIGGKWSLYNNKEMHFIPLIVHSLLPKVEEILCLNKLTNAPIIGISETESDGLVLNMVL